MRITPRQMAALKRIKKNTTEAIAPDLAKQLIRKGLVHHYRDYHRTEWNRVVATLSVCGLTAAGAEFMASQQPSNE